VNITPPVPAVPRSAWLIALLAAGAAGAVIRYSGLAPDWLATHGGDAAWAAAWMFGLLSLRPRLHRSRAAATALAVCWAIELFQLTRIPADLAPHGFIFRLLLGTSFGWRDLAAYAVGIALAALGASLIAQRFAVRPGIPSD
jgi:hypothetical protein